MRIHADLLGERARVTPDREALVDLAGAAPGARYTYAELDERATVLARVLRGSLGLSKGDRVAILAHNRIEFLDAFFAAAKTGVVLVTLGTRLTAAELEAILRDCGASAVLWDGAFEETVVQLRERMPEVAFAGLDGALPGDLPTRLAAVDPAGPFERTPCDGEDLCCLLYTSGTTGRPKGVMIPHRQVAWNAYNTVVAWGLREDDVSPVFTPLYHAGGLFAFLTPIVAVGGTVVLHPHFDAGEAWRAIEAEGATVVLGVPTIWKMMAEDPAFETVDLSRVRWLISGGAPLPEYLIDTFETRSGGGVPFKQGFGMTEVGVNCFQMTVEQARAKRGSIGLPMPFTEVRLVDEEGRDVPDGTVGEMLFRGPHVCLGYWNAPEATATALDGDGWFHSGDLARRDEDGFFYVAGRRKEMLISGGVNVFPAEIEGALLLHPGVEDAAVVGVPHERWGEAGIAFVVCRTGEAEPPDAEALTAFLGERLARYKLPKDYRFLDALPRTAYGKVVKGELRDRYLTERSRDGGGRLTLLAHTVQGPEDGEPILLLNGGMMSHGAWEPVIRPLLDTGRYRTLGCDLRGQALSPGTPPPTLDGQVEEVVRLLDSLGFADTPVHVLGTSFGGETGLLLAATHPERVRSLAAVTVTDFLDEEMREGVAASRRRIAEILAGGGRSDFQDAVAEEVYSERFRCENESFLAAARERLERMPREWFESLDAILASYAAVDLRPCLDAIRCPVLIVIAAHDRVMPPERSRALAEALPREAEAEVAVHPESGHALVVEHPGWLAERYLEFLAGIV